jgi:hypothetical protein
LGAPQPPLRRKEWAHPCRICARRGWAHPCHICAGTGAGAGSQALSKLKLQQKSFEAIGSRLSNGVRPCVLPAQAREAVNCGGLCLN